MSDIELLKLMLHHIRDADVSFGSGGDSFELRRQRADIIEREMRDRELRREVYRTQVNVDQHIRIAVGTCGEGQDRRVVESGFELQAGDHLVAFRER